MGHSPSGASLEGAALEGYHLDGSLGWVDPLWIRAGALYIGTFDAKATHGRDQARLRA